MSVKDKGTHVLMADVSTFQAASCACAIQDMYLDETIGVSVSVSQKQTFPVINRGAINFNSA